MSSRPRCFNLMHAPPRSGAEFPDSEARTELTLLMARLIASSTARDKRHVVPVRELLQGPSQVRLRRLASAQGVSSRSGAPGSGQMRTAKELREAAAAKLQLVGQRILSELFFRMLSETSGSSEQTATVATNSTDVSEHKVDAIPAALSIEPRQKRPRDDIIGDNRTVESKIATPSTTTKYIPHARRALKLTLSDDLQQWDHKKHLDGMNAQLYRQQRAAIMATHHEVKPFSTAFALKWALLALSVTPMYARSASTSERYIIRSCCVVWV